MGFSSLIYNDNTNLCVSKDGVQSIPVFTIRTGFEKNTKPKLGMPYAEQVGNLGSEFYVSAEHPLTLSAHFSTSNLVFTTDCLATFRFQPEAGKDYEIFAMAGNRNAISTGVCQFNLSEIREGYVNEKGIRKGIPVASTEVWIEGQKGWSEHCKKP
jgi:hypothetical protein